LIMAARPRLQIRYFRLQAKKPGNELFKMGRELQQKFTLGFIGGPGACGMIDLQVFGKGLVFLRQGSKKFPIQPREAFSSKKFFIFKSK
ncbi:hypothetical protein, partial [Acidithiobacillus sp.]|uniref:hypothetical protein n=1 Tax=Acidithiobacillus sp. TaxID=1872118 RepID=UPI0025B8A771